MSKTEPGVSKPKQDQELIDELQIRAIYQEPKLTVGNIEHNKHPYLLRGVDVNRIDQVWSTDITFIKINQGVVYLSAIIDWYSRYVLNWSIEVDMDAIHCITTGLIKV